LNGGGHEQALLALVRGAVTPWPPHFGRFVLFGLFDPKLQDDQVTAPGQLGAQFQKVLQYL
jgi:hypothetical protein